MSKIVFAAPVVFKAVSAFKAALHIFAAIAQAVIVAVAGYFFGPIGAIVASILTTAIIAAIFKPPRTTMDAGKVNVRVTEPVRWITAGSVRQGGGVMFADFDTDGNLWYLVVHSDSILTNPASCSYYLDDVLISLDGGRNVLSKDFRLNGKKHDAVTVDGGGQSFVQIWTTTYSETDPVPPRITALDAAFPTWTADHKLVGTTFSVVKMNTIKVEDRYKLYKWRGPLGLGEPAVSIVGQWSNMFDPRDGSQTNGTPTTYEFRRNPVLIWAWFRTHRYGRNKPRSEINWDKVAEQASICDQTVTGIEGDHVRYQCDIGIPEDVERIQGEQQIMLTMDAQLVFDDDGKCWPRVGAYYVPTLGLNRNRDIVAMESQEAQDGESELQGVIVRYTDPASNYTTQPAAPWYNPLYYVPGQSNQFATVDVLACQDHNQAMRLAKAIGLRTQPPHRLFPTVGLRGLRARQERIIDLLYDNTFAGDYEIVTPVEVDSEGVFCGFGLTPIDADRWTLLAGEEKPKSSTTDTSDASAPSAPAGVSIFYANSRIEATFTAPTRADVKYEFQYLLAAAYAIGSTDWVDMTVQMDINYAYSPSNILVGTGYVVRYRAVSAFGIPSAWSSPAAVIGTATLDAPMLLTWTPTTGGGTFTYRNPVGSVFSYGEVWRGTTPVLGAATKIAGPLNGGLGATETQVATGLAIGHYFYWVLVYGTGGETATAGPFDAYVFNDSANPNLFTTDTNDFSTGQGWTYDDSGAPAASPTYTGNVGSPLAPDGTATADRLQFSRGAGTFSRVHKTKTVASATSYKAGVWLISTVAASGPSIRLDGNNGSVPSVQTYWQYYTFTATSGAGTTMDTQLLLFSSIGGSPTAADVYAWGFRLALP